MVPVSIASRVPSSPTLLGAALNSSSEVLWKREPQRFQQRFVQTDHSVGSAIQSKGQLSPDFTAHSGGAGWHGFLARYYLVH